MMPLSYVGWKIFAYRYYRDQPELQGRVSKETLRNDLRQRFQSPDFYVGNLRITHAKSMTEMRLEIHGEEFEIQVTDGPTQRFLYLCTLTSEVVKRWRSEESHKQLMYQVIRRLPWRKKAGAIIEDDHVLLTWLSELEGYYVVPPHEIKPTKLMECPIPEQL
jgi:hypothetical protein